MSRLYSVLRKVISGGQTGADIAGVKTAKLFGIPTGGTMPFGFKTLDGPRPEYATLYGMVEHESPDYAPRTRANVEAADFTLRMAEDWKSPGEVRTLAEIERAKRPHADITLTRRNGVLVSEKPREVQDALTKIVQVRQASLLGAITINVAGNAERTAPGIELAASRILWVMFSNLCEPERCNRCKHPSECHDDAGCRLRDMMSKQGRACECAGWVN